MLKKNVMLENKISNNSSLSKYYDAIELYIFSNNKK